jgi:hypothetical protein
MIMRKWFRLAVCGERNVTPVGAQYDTLRLAVDAAHDRVNPKRRARGLKSITHIKEYRMGSGRPYVYQTLTLGGYVW